MARLSVQSPQRSQLATVAIVAVALVAMLVVAKPVAADASDVPAITITKTVIGDPALEAFEFTITPEVDGCTAEQTVQIDGAGGQAIVEVASAIAGPIAFDSTDFVVTSVFSDVQDFEFSIAMAGITSGQDYTNATFESIDYRVFGSLTNTPSGFPAFNLVRSVPFADFVAQQSSLGFITNDDADLSDGLQIGDLFGPDEVLILDAREIGTGRYHPPRLVLRADGTGRIQNSDNQGGINPQTEQEVNVALGEEYISDLVFDPATFTLAPGVACTYTVTEQPTADFDADTDSWAVVAAGDEVTFVNTAVPALCLGQMVTIDMRTNGGDGAGTPGDDVILGTVGDDLIDAGDGNDTVCAGGGNDVVIGGSGDDLLVGGAGRDIMRGNAGADTLLGEAGQDRLLGGTDSDLLSGGDGDDFLSGFGGADSIDGGFGNDIIFGGYGADELDGGPGDDEIHGLIGDDLINGNSGNDELDGDRGNDVINGGDGDDVIRGGNANDVLNGGDGDDSVNGGKADDQLAGGPGLNDTCAGNLQNVADTADATCETIFGVP